MHSLTSDIADAPFMNTSTDLELVQTLRSQLLGTSDLHFLDFHQAEFLVSVYQVAGLSIRAAKYPKDLANPRTSMNFFKQLTDSVNSSEFERYDGSDGTFDDHIDSIHFYYNMVLIKKK